MSIAVVGASGLVGKELIRMLEQSGHDVIAFGNRSVGQRVQGSQLVIHDLKDFDESHISGVMVSAGQNVSRLIKERLKTAWLIDNSSAFRQMSGVPLVVPEIYDGPSSNVIASPNCVAIPVSLVVHALKPLGDLKKIWGSTYQSISGAGIDAMHQMSQGQGIYNNVSPLIGEMNDNGLTGEEDKIVREIQKINQINIPIDIMAVRVPIEYGHSVNLRLELENQLNIHDAIEILQDCPYIKLYKDDAPEPNRVQGCHLVHVGRLRKTESKVLGMWLVSNNILRGAAWNMMQIAKKQGFLENGG